MLEDADDSSSATVAARQPSLLRLAAVWGTLFWLPLFVPILLAIVLLHGDRLKSIQLLVFTAPVFLVLLLAALWWATRGRRIGSGTFVLAGFCQGLALIVVMVLTVIAISWAGGEHSLPGSTDIEELARYWVYASLYLLSLGAVVVWRARRRVAKRAVSAQPDARSDDSRRLPRIVLPLLGPLLFGVPLIAILCCDTYTSEQAAMLLDTEIARIHAQIPDLNDADRIKSRVLSRARIIEVLESGTPRVAAALSFAGHLPPGTQLTSLQMNDQKLTVWVICETQPAEFAILARLGEYGWRGLHIVARSPSGAEVKTPIQIEARWPREEGQ